MIATAMAYLMFGIFIFGGCAQLHILIKSKDPKNLGKAIINFAIAWAIAAFGGL